MQHTFHALPADFILTESIVLLTSDGAFPSRASTSAWSSVTSSDEKHDDDTDVDVDVIVDLDNNIVDIFDWNDSSSAALPLDREMSLIWVIM